MLCARSIGDTIGRAADLLEAVSASARLDAEILVGHACGLSRAGLLRHAARPLTSHETRRVERAVARRARGEPVAYITGRREFWSLSLTVTRQTLIPRPETERLVEAALAHLPRDERVDVADLGTGCGAVALAIASERPRGRVLATDVCAGAVAVARENAVALGIGNIEFGVGRWLQPLVGRAFDLIVANPPYVAADDLVRRAELRFEPRAALSGGRCGLSELRIVIADAGAHLRPGGRIVLEHGYDQGEAVRALMAAAGYVHIATHRDCAGHERVSEGRTGFNGAPPSRRYVNSATTGA